MTSNNNHSLPSLENRDIACFLVTKHSWKGKYKRVFGVGTHGITTYNPSTLETTNHWSYGDFYSIRPSQRAGSVPGEFVINMRSRSKKQDSMRFSSEYSGEILTTAMKLRHLFVEPRRERKRVNGYKHHWSDSRVPVVLEVSEASLNQVDQKGQILAEYEYRKIVEFVKLSDYPGGFCIVYGTQQRWHLFACQGCDDLIQSANHAAYENVGLGCKVRKEQLAFKWFATNRLGRCSDDKQLTSFVEFTVHKVTKRNPNPVRRLLCLSETCILERDPATYLVITVRPLLDIHSLVRSETNPQLFQIEYETGDIRSYTATERDNILASLLDGVRAAGNNNVHVRMSLTERGFRWTPYSVNLDEDTESQLIKLLCSSPAGAKKSEILRRFNANIPYSGLLYSVTQEGFFTENKEKLIVNCVQAVMGAEGDQKSVEEWETQFQALHRLFASKAGFHAFTSAPGLREKLGCTVIAAIKLNNEAVNHAAIDMLCALLQPMHSNYEIRQEQLNKSSLLASKKFLEHLLDVMAFHVSHGTGALVIACMLDFLTYALCVPYSETTMGDQFDSLLELVASKGRVMYKLFQFPSMTIVKGAGLVMRAIIEESDAETSQRMQELALAEGALLKHLHLALFTQSKDVRMLTNRQLSRHLVMLWVTGNEAAMELLDRSLPKGLLNFLSSKEEVPAEEEMLLIRNNLNLAVAESDQRTNVVTQQLIEVQRAVEKQLDTLLQHWRLRQKLSFLKKEEKQQKPVVLRKRRERVKTQANWKLFFYKFCKDHSQSDLIWNHKTREELREAFESELRALNVDKELIMTVPLSWNHSEFEVQYQSLSGEVRIGDYFLRILLEEDEHSDRPTPILQPKEFFNDVYHHFLLSAKAEMRSICLQALAVIYGRHFEEIGPFPDTRYILAMLEKCTDRGERDRILVFLSKLILHKRNVRDVINANGVPVLVDFASLAHLHVSRAYIHTQTNVIEAAPDMSREGAKEWYYSGSDGSRQGPVSFQELKKSYSDELIGNKTRCWAQGLEGWKPLSLIPQLRWTLSAGGSPTMNETELAVLVLKMLIQMCEYYPSRDEDGCVVRPVPKVKKILSQVSCLPHVVQLLLTFDPVIVEKSATLLFLVMQDNPYISRLYLSGLFFFILMYTGSNVLPIANLLHYTHMKQAFRSEVPKSDIIQCSVLSPILPEATIYYLENYGPEKYSEVFLGEFDNPEVIWNAEMRRQMIEKLAAHIADFSHRLPSNIKALYQYCPIPAVAYPKLEEELFCYIYYLRHLCDTVKFPDWPIREPIAFLKACLTAWNEEIEKKPPSMSTEEACQILNVQPEILREEESSIRRAYFKLAQKYHPDKNPEGREMFEKINSAYEFLCSRTSKSGSGPDSERIVLCLKAQSIVYSRHMEELAPYKYAGYTQLIKTIRLETEDEALFSKGAPLLSAATELCYFTLACSALNAEQLRRENGLEALAEAFNRCVSVLGQSSRPDDLAVQVCLHVCRCFSTAAQFEGCREKLSQMPQLFSDICHVLYFKHLVKLCCVAAESVRSLSVCTILQLHLFQSGVLWYLIPNLFQYDYTLDEGGVQKSEESNQQELENRLARMSCEACAALAGYREDTPDNDGVQSSLRAMLTPYINRLMRESPVDFILKILNSNTENPYLIWDNGTRIEVLEFVESQRSATIKTSELHGAEFVFSAHQKELVIGDIFIRVYNEQPNFILENSKAFCIELLDFLGKKAQYMHSLLSLGADKQGKSNAGGDPSPFRQVEMALEALGNVLKADPGLEMQCIGHFKLLFAYLRVDARPELQLRTLEVVSLAANNQECVGDIAASNTLVYLFLLLHSLPRGAKTVLSTLFTLSSNGKVVKDALALGGLMYILDLLCNGEDGECRSCAAELLGKLQADKLTGPRWTRNLLKFLPPIFSEAARDSASGCVQLFDTTTENPELIWNDDTRNKVKRLLSSEAALLYEKQKDDPEYTWKIPEDMVCAYEDVVSGEFVVGGVFLRLFIANPSWVLRQPRQFLTELLERNLAEMRSNKPNGDVLETLSTALVSLLQNNPSMTDQISTQGYVPQVVEVMDSSDKGVARSCILLFQQLSKNEMCVESLSNTECIPGIMTVMKLRKDLSHPASQGLRALFDKDNAQLIEQALREGLVEFLLGMLGSILVEVDNSAAVKAEIVNTLKAMTVNLECGGKVNDILTHSKIWAEFKDQRHDLFLANTPQIGYLTAGAGAAGYLTQGLSHNQPQMVPPPP